MPLEMKLAQIVLQFPLKDEDEEHLDLFYI